MISIIQNETKNLIIKLENHDDLKRNRIQQILNPFTLYVVRSIEFIKELIRDPRI